MCAVTASPRKSFPFNPTRTTSLTMCFAMRPCKEEPSLVIVGTQDSSMALGVPSSVDFRRPGQSVIHCWTQPCSTHCSAKDPSNSQEPRVSSRVPIPVREDRIADVSNQEERTSLTRMYDYATWKMYERIVRARRQRQCLLDAHQTLRINDSSDTTSSHDNFPLGTSEVQKASSYDSITVDESDKSSGSSLSSSMSTSWIQSPSFPSSATIENVPSECFQEEKVLVLEGENQEYFIFELDL